MIGTQAGCSTAAAAEAGPICPAARRHVFKSQRLTPKRRAMAEMFASGSALSASIRAFSSSVQSAGEQAP